MEDRGGHARGGRRPIALLISPKPARLAQIRSAAHEALPGCEAVRLYAKDLMDPRASAAVSVPVRSPWSLGSHAR